MMSLSSPRVVRDNRFVINESEVRLDTGPPGPSRAVRMWLLLAAALVLATVLVGGWTRLTDSGLSITEWKPVTGVIPPLDADDWADEFRKYKETYQSKKLNFDMTLDEFKRIFGWEWWHRTMGRLVFLSVLLPFGVFAARGRLSGELKRKLWLVLGLIALQGFIGWYMVSGSLDDDVKVMPYRLALHLGVATTIFCALLSIGLGQDQRTRPQTTVHHWVGNSIRMIVALVFALIIFGALVAGHRAGRTYDTWPLMAGQLIPAGLFNLSPWYVNFFQNDLTVQFIHRLLAYALCLFVFVHWARVQRYEADARLQRGARLLALAVLVQVALGIITIWLTVPPVLGSLHQLTAFCVFTLGIWHLYEIERHPVKALEDGSFVPADVPVRANPLTLDMAARAQKAATAVIDYGKRRLDERRNK